jgi:hypothetical protein
MKTDLEKAIFNVLVKKYKCFNKGKELSSKTQETLSLIASERAKEFTEELSDEVFQLTLIELGSQMRDE